MGRTQDGFAQAIVDVVQQHAPDFDPATLEMRASSAGNYLSLTCTVNATSREQLDDLYRELIVAPDGGDGAVSVMRASAAMAVPRAIAVRRSAPPVRGDVARDAGVHRRAHARRPPTRSG